jgi:hypothetical protein
MPRSLAKPSKTVDQRREGDSYAKAGELIQVRGIAQLTLHDRRVLNLLYERAGERICDDVEHTVSLSELRGLHKGGERIKDSVLELMKTVVQVSTIGRNGKPATKLIPLLSDTTLSDDDGDPTGEVVYSFSKAMRNVIKNSTHWGRVRGAVMFAFGSKYSLALYELSSMRVNLKHKWSEDFSLKDIRSLLGVPDGKLMRSPDLVKYCFGVAEAEVNRLADFGVKIEPIRIGTGPRSRVTGVRLSWWKKGVPAMRLAHAELTKGRGKVVPDLDPTELPTALG